MNIKHRALEIYLAGCKGYCRGCHNPELWDFAVGQAWQEQIGAIKGKIADLQQAGLIQMVWLLGGEPLDQDLTELVNLLEELHQTGVPLMLWTHCASVPNALRPYLAYAKVGKYVQDGQSYIEPVLQIRLANKEQIVVKLEAEPMNILDVPIRKLHPDAVIPTYKKAGDAGFDLYAVEDVEIAPGAVKIVPTGLAFSIPEGYEMQLRMRSGASLHTPLIMPNAPATIDSGYRGEVGIILRNVGTESYTVHKGERLVQGVIAPVIQANLIVSVTLPESERGAGGYGSTGTR